MAEDRLSHATLTVARLRRGVRRARLHDSDAATVSALSRDASRKRVRHEPPVTTGFFLAAFSAQCTGLLKVGDDYQFQRAMNQQSVV